MIIIIINIVIIIIFTWLQGGGHAVVPGVDQHPRRVHALPAQGGQGGAWNSIQGLNRTTEGSYKWCCSDPGGHSRSEEPYAIEGGRTSKGLVL